MALKLKEKPSKRILGDKMIITVQEVRTIYRRIDQLNEKARRLIEKIVEETNGILSRVIYARGGYRNRYGTYYLNVSDISDVNECFNVSIGDTYIDYMKEVFGEYCVIDKKTKYVRFPIPYEGPVLIVPTDYGFRVYLLK